LIFLPFQEPATTTPIPHKSKIIADSLKNGKTINENSYVESQNQQCRLSISSDGNVKITRFDSLIRISCFCSYYNIYEQKRNDQDTVLDQQSQGYRCKKEGSVQTRLHQWQPGNFDAKLAAENIEICQPVHISK